MMALTQLAQLLCNPLQCKHLVPHKQHGVLSASDASYLTAPKGRSHVTGYHFLRRKPIQPPTANDKPPPDNGLGNVLCQFLCNVVASTAEAKLGALFLNAQYSLLKRNWEIHNHQHYFRLTYHSQWHCQ